MDEDDYVGWCRYTHDDDGCIKTIEMCSSGAKGAFKVYRSIPEIFNSREERIVKLIAALKRAKETIRAFNGMGLKGGAEKTCWDAYQHSPEMKQINAVLESDV